MKSTAKRIAALAVLLSVALILFLVESLIPPDLPMAPYVKIGIANCVVLFVLIVFGAKDAFLFVLAKNLLGALFGSWFAFAFNIAGSMAAFAVMTLFYRCFFPKVSLVCISIAGAVCSNIARTAVAVVMMETQSLFVQLPVICAFSIPAGALVGILTVFLIRFLPARLTYFRKLK